MTRGFGIDASVPLDVALAVAGLAEQAGYGSFWVNGSPHDAALDIIEGALSRTGLDVGVGVFPLPKISAGELVEQVKVRELPEERLWLGVGSDRRPGALDDVRSAVRTFRDELGVVITTGAVGPRMLALAGEAADAVILTWSFQAEVEKARPIIEDAADKASRVPPTLVSFIRCGLLPQAADAIRKRATAYDAIPHYHEVFERNGVTAGETVVTGTSREELLSGIEREESVLDLSVIRAIPAENTVASIAELVEACRP